MRSKQLQLAKNPNTPAARLIELAKIEDEEILALIAKNPNNPPNLLVELAGVCLEEIGENPALSLILMECPNFLSDIYYEHFNFLEAITVRDFSRYNNLMTRILLDWFLKAGVDCWDGEVKNYIALNLFTSGKYLERLVKDKNRKIRMHVAQHSNTPSLTLLKLALDADKTVRKSAKLYVFFRYKKLLRILIFVGGISITIIALAYLPPLPVFLILPLNFILLAIAAYRMISKNSR